MSVTDFRALHDRVRRAARAGVPDRGALDEITPARVLAAVREVTSGRTVTLAASVATEPGPDNPRPAEHRMIGVVAGDVAPSGLQFAMDRIAMNVHGDADSHIDALCHVVYDGTLYNGVAASTLTPSGAHELSIDLARDGIVGRGVLLDIPRLLGVAWLEPGDHVTGDNLADAASAQSVQVTPGDLLFVRVGHRRRQRELGPWNTAEARVGLHPTAMEFLADHRVSVLGSDGNNDTAPSLVKDVAFPVHVLAVHAMGLHLLDYLQFEDLVPLCEAEQRWSFLCVIAPVRLPAATGSPINPIAIL